MKKNTRKSYSELMKLKSPTDRFQYLKIGGKAGEETFGLERYLNQAFYKSDKWLSFRDKIIERDNGCDLGLEGYDIYGTIIVHHINPITKDDIIDMNPCLLDPENAICVSINTHNAIHYGNGNLLPSAPIERTKNDTCPWRHG